MQLSTRYESFYSSGKKVGYFYTPGGWWRCWYLYRNSKKYLRCEYEDTYWSSSWSSCNRYSSEIWYRNLLSFPTWKRSFSKVDRPSELVVITKIIILFLALRIFQGYESVHILFLLERGFFVHQEGFLRVFSHQK